MATRSARAAYRVTTFCRIFEPMCGLVARVEDGRVVSVRPDKDHRFSQSFACIKAAAMIDVTEDPDRVVTPLRRVGGPGTCLRVRVQLLAEFV